jgi:hypothetical protein
MSNNLTPLDPKPRALTELNSALAALPAETRQQILAEYARRVAAIKAEADGTQAAIDNIGQVIDNVVEGAIRAHQEGVSFQATNVSTTSAGRTEIIAGNTEQAQTGRLTRSQAGETSNFNWWLLVIAAVVIIGIIAAAGHH